MIPGVDFLKTYERDQLLRDVGAISSDEAGARSIDYHHRTAAPATDLTTGVQTPAETVYPRVGAVRREAYRDRDRGEEASDFWWIIPTAQLPIGEVTMADKIVDGRESFNVVRGSTDPSGVVWRIMTRREEVPS